jgi:DNA-binding transcriptional LysR family regulator
MSIGQVSDIDIRLLKVFKCVVECGGFTAAEGMLNITRAAISLRMTDLEERLQVRLCRRGRGGFSLTDEGKVIYEATLKLFEDLETFRLKANEVGGDLRGELRFGITDSLLTSPHTHITQAFNALREMGPAIRFSVQMTHPEDVERGVIDGRFHLGAVPDSGRTSTFDYHPLYDEEVLLYCVPSHPLAQETDDDAVLQKLGMFEAAALESEATSTANRPQIALNVSAKSTDREGVAFLILSGNYIGYLPAHYAQRWVAEGQMRALIPQRLSHQISYCIINRRSAVPHQLTKLFLESLGRIHIAHTPPE